MRPSWVEIDLDAIEHNVRTIAQHIAPAELCAVVKADAYGHGDVPVALAAIEAGAGWLAVALVEEGVRLREADVDIPILVLSEPRLEDVASIVAHGLTPTAYRSEFVDALAEVASETATLPYPVHLKLDTGMHRVGASPVEAFEIARAIEADERLHLQGVFTHFAVADEDAGYTKQQHLALTSFLESLGDEGIHPRIIHAANTAASLDLAETRHTMCRVGLGVYGLRPASDTGPGLDLRPAMTVVSHVQYVRRLPEGARPSYGRIREIAGSHDVATIPIGYADGVSRTLSVPGEVLICGKRYPFAGQITMDMIIVDVGRDDVPEGERVVLLGRQGSEEISAEDWATMLGTINYEVVCRFGPRLPRRYVRNGSTDD
ncbi:MAG: alanine racemase [Proteobacteria bacterium]|nr:alanine racemase [Pseudomonadota bacterium]